MSTNKPYDFIFSKLKGNRSAIRSFLKRNPVAQKATVSDLRSRVAEIVNNYDALVNDLSSAATIAEDIDAPGVARTLDYISSEMLEIKDDMNGMPALLRSL